MHFDAYPQQHPSLVWSPSVRMSHLQLAEDHYHSFQMSPFIHIYMSEQVGSHTVERTDPIHLLLTMTFERYLVIILYTSDSISSKFYNHILKNWALISQMITWQYKAEQEMNFLRQHDSVTGSVAITTCDKIYVCYKWIHHPLGYWSVLLRNNGTWCQSVSEAEYDNTRVFSLTMSLNRYLML